MGAGKHGGTGHDRKHNPQTRKKDTDTELIQKLKTDNDKHLKKDNEEKVNVQELELTTLGGGH